MITKPLLAARVEDNSLDTLRFPVAVTKKIDGLRCIKVNGQAVSRTFKPIPNKHIRSLIEKHAPENMDMEITSGKTFQECTGNIMRHDGEPSFKLWIIDFAGLGNDQPFLERIKAVEAYVKKNWKDVPFEYEVLSPTMANNKEELLALESKIVGQGFEGAMVRDPYGPYKCGRSTFKEGILIKIKRFSDTEAKVLDIVELMHNENTAEKDNFGRTKRSTAKDGLVPADTMGNLMVVGLEGEYKGVEFSVGTGFDQATRDYIWKNKKKFLGKTVKVKYFPTGAKDAPRFPTFLGFRDKEDM